MRYCAFEWIYGQQQQARRVPRCYINKSNKRQIIKSNISNISQFMENDKSESFLDFYQV